jgi:hypothetical protein
MRDYPISSFLFWEVEKQNISNFQFYEFVREYHERDNTHNPKADISGEKWNYRYVGWSTASYISLYRIKRNVCL